MPCDGSALVEVLVTEDWDLGGRLYRVGETLEIKASRLVMHVKSGKCVPKARAAEFAKIRAAQAKANEEARAAEARAEADARKLEEEAVEAAVGEGTSPGGAPRPGRE